MLYLSEEGELSTTEYKRVQASVEHVQRRFTKTLSKTKTKRIIGMKNRDYEDRLKSLNLPSLEFRQTRPVSDRHRIDSCTIDLFQKA